MKPKRITKKWRKEQAQLIIDRNVLEVPFSSADASEFSEVCQHDIEGAVRKVNPQFPSDPRHLHMLVDDQWQPYSWNKLISALTPEQEVKRVMRFAIRDDLADFRMSVDPQACEQCGSTEYLTTDHMLEPFDNIANDFIAESGLPKICKSPCANMVVSIFADMNQEADFIAYHASRATYQLLCRSCNSRKGKR